MYYHSHPTNSYVVGCLSPVKKMPRLQKSFFASYGKHKMLYNTRKAINEFPWSSLGF